MYYLTAKETDELAKDIRKCKTREEGYKQIDDFAKKVGCFDKNVESCFKLFYPNNKILYAIRWISKK